VTSLAQSISKFSQMNVKKVKTGIAVEFLEGHYGRIVARSSMVINNQINIKGGVIDPSLRKLTKLKLKKYQL